MTNELFNLIRTNLKKWTRIINNKLYPSEKAEPWFKECFDCYIDAYLNELRIKEDNSIVFNIEDDEELKSTENNNLVFYGDEDPIENIDFMDFYRMNNIRYRNAYNA